MISAQPSRSTTQLVLDLQEARARLLELVADLDDEQMIGPRMPIVNPLRWEIAHVAFFQEFWLLRHLRGHEAIRPAEHLDPDPHPINLSKLLPSAGTMDDFGFPLREDSVMR